ncbi:MAG: gamma-glutamyl-gamma-aminobutyrate hydrolase family protein [Lentimicrobium sp.]|nr:gamma-glutamyl-gamma-aminobutyrate hydrolase family protein [Lentimicrobium sp.]
MKHLALLSISLLLVFSLQAQQYFGTPEAKAKPCLILMNPTANNLRTIFYLIDNQIFLLPEEYNLVGFYHSAQSYDFSRSKDYIYESGRSNVYLHECAEEPGSNIFSENPCSNDFVKAFEGSNGVIFFGGPDIPPALYGEETNLLTEITDYHRHTFEASFLFHLLGGYQNNEFIPLLEQKPDYRILGICLGMQTINIATGGTLIQDIPTIVYDQKSVEQVLTSDRDDRHRNYFTHFGTDDNLVWGDFHRIMVTLPERLNQMMLGSGPNPYVLSSHHQAAGRIGKGMLIAATSIDGKIVEALVHEKYPNVIGFQFHPEPPFLYQSESKISFEPGKTASHSFIDLYGGEMGLEFNRNIWKWMGLILSLP